jgi:hypothetical protein
MMELRLHHDNDMREMVKVEKTNLKYYIHTMNTYKQPSLSLSTIILILGVQSHQPTEHRNTAVCPKISGTLE